MNDGGPAYPITEVPNRATIHVGLTIRDWFAGLALSSLSASNFDKYADMAHDAYQIADAMLAAREHANA